MRARMQRRAASFRASMARTGETVNSQVREPLLAYREEALADIQARREEIETFVWVPFRELTKAIKLTSDIVGIIAKDTFTVVDSLRGIWCRN